MEGYDRLCGQRRLTPTRGRRYAQSGNTANARANRSANAASGYRANQSANTRKPNRIAHRIRRLINTLVPPEIRRDRIRFAAKRYIRKLEL
jgi:hypothetical protein